MAKLSLLKSRCWNWWGLGHSRWETRRRGRPTLTGFGSIIGSESSFDVPHIFVYDRASSMVWYFSGVGVG